MTGMSLNRDVPAAFMHNFIEKQAKYNKNRILCMLCKN